MSGSYPLAGQSNSFIVFNAVQQTADRFVIPTRNKALLLPGITIAHALVIPGMKVLVRGYFYKIGLKELSVFYPAVQFVQQDIYGFR